MPDDIEPHNTPAEAAEAITASDEAASGAPVPDALAEARRERDDYYDRLLRKTAEFDNYRKRTERERREMAQYATGDVLEALLPIVDGFERALQADAGADAGAYRKGVELIYKQLQDVLAKRGVTPIDPLGESFDPHWHDAVVREAATDGRDGEVTEVFSRGYRLGDRLLRPAMVKVATA